METAVTERRSTDKPSGSADTGIDRLFDRFGAIYGSEKWIAQWRGQELRDVKRLWTEELRKLTAEELRAGVEQLRAKHPTWPPTLFEFLDLCRPSAAAIDPEVAFHEAVRGLEARRNGSMDRWSHRAVYWAAIDVTAFEVLGSPWPHVRARWTRALESRLADPNLPQIPEPPKRLPAPELLSRDEAGARLADLKSKLDNRPASPPTTPERAS